MCITMEGMCSNTERSVWYEHRCHLAGDQCIGCGAITVRNGCGAQCLASLSPTGFRDWIVATSDVCVRMTHDAGGCIGADLCERQ
jgi:hypothetical protein